MRAWVIAAGLGVLALAVATGAPAKIYKWVDEEGQTHYGQQPPNGVEAAPMSVHTAPPSSGGGTPSTAGGTPAGGGGDDAGSKTAKADDAISQNCRTAKQNLSILESAGPGGSYRSPDGETLTYTEEEWQKRVDQNKRYVENFCQEE